MSNLAQAAWGQDGPYSAAELLQHAGSYPNEDTEKRAKFAEWAAAQANRVSTLVVSRPDWRAEFLEGIFREVAASRGELQIALYGDERRENTLYGKDTMPKEGYFGIESDLRLLSIIDYPTTANLAETLLNFANKNPDFVRNNRSRDLYVYVMSDYFSQDRRANETVREIPFPVGDFVFNNFAAAEDDPKFEILWQMPSIEDAKKNMHACFEALSNLASAVRAARVQYGEDKFNKLLARNSYRRFFEILIVP